MILFSDISLVEIESIQIAAGVTKTTKISSAGDDAKYASPSGKTYQPTSYEDDVAKNDDLAKNLAPH